MTIIADNHERYVFWVPSKSEPSKPRRVDVEALDFFGDCACPEHDVKNRGAGTKHHRAENKIGKPSETWCSHIRRARKFHVMEQARAAAAKAYDAAIEEIRPR